MSCRGENGLTLVELLVALAVGALILVMVQGVFIGASELRESSRLESELYHRSRVILDRLDRELGSTLFHVGRPFASFELTSGGEPRLEFSSFASTPAVEGSGRGAVFISYRWQRDAEGELLELLRNERSLQTPYFADEASPLLRRVKGLEVRCFDGESWSDTWDSRQSGRLPRLLEVSFSLDSEGSEERFRTVMEIGGGSGS